jgi:penicillin V acylase-like amidase (Ntn superfamily)
MSHQSKLAFGAILLIVFYQNAFPCTGFSVKNGNHIVVCFNYDFQFGAGQIYINKRNTERRRFLLYAEKPILWTSKYGSITFNLVGRDWPHDGMNENGLVILSMGLDDTKFQNPDDRLSIDENGWIQYQLDNSASIVDVLDNMKKLRISKRSIGDSHFLIVDSTGRTLVIEYVNGQEKTYIDDKLPYTILANDTYSNMLNYLNQQKTFGGVKEEDFRVASSCCRFTWIADKLRHLNPSSDSLIDYGFGILDEMKQSNTQYQIVYDVKGRTIFYKSRNTNNLKSIPFSDVDFNCTTPVLMTNIQSAVSGNIRNEFYPYDSKQSNKALVEFNKKTFEYLPDEALSCLVGTSNNSKCRGEEPNYLDSDTKVQNEEIARSNPLIVSMHKPKEDSVVVANTGENVSFDFTVELNRSAEKDVDFILEVPDSSGLIPGNNVFIVPNPVRIEKGNANANIRAIIISAHMKKGFDKYLVVNLLSERAKLGNEKQFRIKIRRDVKSK